MQFMIATVTVWGGLVYAGFELFDPEERNKKVFFFNTDYLYKALTVLYISLLLPDFMITR